MKLHSILYFVETKVIVVISFTNYQYMNEIFKDKCDKSYQNCSTTILFFNIAVIANKILRWFMEFKIRLLTNFRKTNPIITFQVN